MDVMAKKVTETKPVIKQAGRPEKPIDWEIVDRLLEAGCTATEICPFFNIHADTLCRRIVDEKGMLFTDYAAEMHAKGDANIKATQYMKAIGQSTLGDNVQLVWLGKNRLKQRENPTELTVSNETVQSFKNIMDQVSKAQEALKIEETNSIKE